MVVFFHSQRKLQDKFSPEVNFPCHYFDLTSNMQQTKVSNRCWYPYVRSCEVKVMHFVFFM